MNADLGLTLALGVVCAIPCVIIAGPLFANLAAVVGRRPGAGAVRRREERRCTGTGGTGGVAGAQQIEADTGPRQRTGTAVPAPAQRSGTTAAGRADGRGRPPPRPSFGRTLATVLLPVALMLAKAVAD